MLYKVSQDCGNNAYKSVLQSHITHILTGQHLLPLPQVDKRTYSATEIGEILGISSHRVGMLANAYDLKTEQYGRYFYDKAKSANKQIETFRYYDSVIAVLKRLLEVA